MRPAVMRRATLRVAAAVGSRLREPALLVRLSAVLQLQRCQPRLHKRSRREAQQQGPRLLP